MGGEDALQGRELVLLQQGDPLIPIEWSSGQVARIFGAERVYVLDWLSFFFSWREARREGNKMKSVGLKQVCG